MVAEVGLEPSISRKMMMSLMAMRRVAQGSMGAGEVIVDEAAEYERGACGLLSNPALRQSRSVT